jgi:hypothetical protein
LKLSVFCGNYLSRLKFDMEPLAFDPEDDHYAGQFTRRQHRGHQGGINQGFPLRAELEASFFQAVMTHYTSYGERFIALMDKHLPQWRARQQELKEAPLAHEAWGY